MQFSCHDGMKKTTSWLATVFGLLGTLISLILIVAIWISCFNFNSAVYRSTERISDSLTLVQDQALKFDKSIENSRSAVDNLGNQIQEQLSSFSLKTELPPGTLSPLIETSEQISGKLQNWRDLIGAIEEVLLALNELFQELPRATLPNDSDRQPLLSTLQACEAHLDQAITAFEELPAQLKQLPSRPRPNLYSALIKPRVNRIDEALAQTLVGSETFKNAAQKLNESIVETRTRLKKLTFLTAFAGSLLLIWFGAGQVCLAQVGLRKIKSTSPVE